MSIPLGSAVYTSVACWSFRGASVLIMHGVLYFSYIIQVEVTMEWSSYGLKYKLLMIVTVPSCR